MAEQNSPPPNLDLRVCFILSLHDNDTNIKGEEKSSNSSKNIEELNDTNTVRRDKADFFFPRKYDNYFSRLKMLSSFYKIKGDDKTHSFKNYNNTHTGEYIKRTYIFAKDDLLLKQ